MRVDRALAGLDLLQHRVIAQARRHRVDIHVVADVRGTAILLVEQARAEDDMWIYLPALKKARRLVASNKKDSFAGTDFSYGDVIGQPVEKWRHALKSEGEAGGEACYVVDSLPARDSARDESGYSKRHSCISKARFTLLRLETWDTEGQPQKVAEFSDSRVDASVPKETFSARAPEFGG